MSDNVALAQTMNSQDDEAAFVTNHWNKFNDQRAEWVRLKEETRSYLFATDTRHTDVGDEGWAHNTTLPKLCQIRDNLHSNYIQALFPNDKWLTWEAYTRADAEFNKSRSITTYMENKTREGGFREEISKVVNDYIDFGICFVTCEYESNHRVEANGEKTPLFIGPKAKRISPYDIVFDPTARSFDESYKIVRTMTSISNLMALANSSPDQEFWSTVIEKRKGVSKALAGTKASERSKNDAYQIEGFGSLAEYYGGDSVEVLEFWGDYYDHETETLHENMVITIVDRSTVVRKEKIPNWMGRAPIQSSVWRERPDNLWGMGPLDNLVGMQYKLDHWHNMASEAIDLSIRPPIATRGVVEEFEWAPGSEIQLGEDGTVQELGKNLNGVFAANAQIQELENRMEFYAGSPREAMGFRTPGEKTLGEVNQLANAGNRIFQEKITNFEITCLEPLLNLMLETSVRNMDLTDTVRVYDSKKNMTDFLSVTKDDITASGVLRPIGARHFAKQAQDFQNIMSIFNSPMGEMVKPHTSALGLVEFIKDSTNLGAYKVFEKNVAIEEQQDIQREMSQSQEDLAVESGAPTMEEAIVTQSGIDEETGRGL